MHLAVNQLARAGLCLFTALLVYDGGIRKWVFPYAEQLVFVIKDALLAGLLVLLVGLLGRQGRWVLPPLCRLFLLLYAAWVLLEVANVHQPSLLVPAWGLKSHLLYAGLLVLVPIAFPSVEELLRFLARAFPWLVVPVCIVAIVQLASPDTSFINRGIADYGAGTAYFGRAMLVRVTGTFSYISGMAAFIQSAALLGIGLLVAGFRSPGLLLGLAFVIALLPATGSRSVIVVVSVGTLLILIAGVLAGRVRLSRFLYLCSTVVILLVGSFYLQDTAWQALQQRSARASHDHDRIFTGFTNAFHYFADAGLTGFGTGSANYGAVALASGIVPYSWLPMGSRFEEESGRIVIELGIVGWFLSLAMRLAFLGWALKLVCRGATVAIRSAAMIALPAMALGFYLGSGVFAPPVAAAYYWFSVAMLGMAQHKQLRERQARPAQERAGTPLEPLQ